MMEANYNEQQVQGAIEEVAADNNEVGEKCIYMWMMMSKEVLILKMDHFFSSEKKCIIILQLQQLLCYAHLCLLVGIFSSALK